MRRTCLTGLDRLLLDPARFGALGCRAGLLGHPASVSARFEHAADALLAAGVDLVRLFGPEHGLRGEAQYMEAVGHEVDPLTGIESVSLYGAEIDDLRPKPEQLADLDLVIIDLQDVGSRYYTYIYTALFMAEACAKAGVRCLLLDRPNPIGDAVEGPALIPAFRSFVGWLNLPTRHGLTTAEVLTFARQQGWELTHEVVPMEGYSADLWMDHHTAPWVLPSPNMPTMDTALVYPGMCLLEGTNISEGRGTTRPFEMFGAPFVNAPALAALLESLPLPGVCWRRCAFVPTFDKFTKERCYGLGIHVTDRQAYRPLLTGAAIVWAIARLHPDHFAWRSDAYEFVDDIPAIDLLFGSDEPRRLIDAGAPFGDLAAALETPAELLAAVTAARRSEYHGPR